MCISLSLPPTHTYTHTHSPSLSPSLPNRLSLTHSHPLFFPASFFSVSFCSVHPHFAVHPLVLQDALQAHQPLSCQVLRCVIDPRLRASVWTPPPPPRARSPQRNAFRFSLHYFACLLPPALNLSFCWCFSFFFPSLSTGCRKAPERLKGTGGPGAMSNPATVRGTVAQMHMSWSTHLHTEREEKRERERWGRHMCTCVCVCARALAHPCCIWFQHLCNATGVSVPRDQSWKHAHDRVGAAMVVFAWQHGQTGLHLIQEDRARCLRVCVCACVSACVRAYVRACVMVRCTVCFAHGPSRVAMVTLLVVLVLLLLCCDLLVFPRFSPSWEKASTWPLYLGCFR